MNKEEIQKIAENNGWVLVDDQAVPVLIFQKGTAKLNVYWSKMTIATTIDHPKGRKQLFRKKVTEEELRKIFENPRSHTDRGYFRKDDFINFGYRRRRRNGRQKIHNSRSTAIEGI